MIYKAFTPFVSNKKDNAGGSGLGLSICRELVSQMGQDTLDQEMKAGSKLDMDQAVTLALEEKEY